VASTIELSNIKLEQAVSFSPYYKKKPLTRKLFIPSSPTESFTIQTSFCASSGEAIIHSNSVEATEWKKNVSAIIKLDDRIIPLQQKN
jgi:hypothetical protein